MAVVGAVVRIMFRNKLNPPDLSAPRREPMLKHLLSALMLAAFMTASADTHIVYSDGSYIKIKDNVVAMGDGQAAVHIEAGSDVYKLVDYKEESYMAIEKESMQNAQNAMMAQLEAQLANVPAEQREMVRQMMKNRMPAMQDKAPEPVFSVEKTDEKGEAAGFACRVNTMLVDGQPRFRICVTPAKAVGVPAEDVETMYSAMDAMRDLAQSFPGAPKRSVDDIDMRKIGGIPLIHEDLQRKKTNQVTSISTDSLDPIVIPEGFEERRMEDMMRGL